MSRINEDPRSTRQSPAPNRAMWLVGTLAVLTLALSSHRMISRQQKAAHRNQAIGNMRSLHCAFLEFDQEFGSFPDDQTAPVVAESTGSDLVLTGTHSNPYFRQLIAYGIQSEDIFHAVHPEGIHKPDRILTPGHALAAGEAGMSYVYGLSSSADPRTPLLIAPMKSGTHHAWRRPYDHKAAVLTVGITDDPFGIQALDINRRGEILLADGSLLLDPAQAYWHGRTIDIRHPELPDSP
jgi:hypothetical protein